MAVRWKRKKKIWIVLDGLVESISREKRVVIGSDFNGQIGEGNRGDEDVMGRFVVKGSNQEGQVVVDFAKRD